MSGALQVCSANGWLPGQQSPTVVFARAPKTLDVKGTTGKPFGQCGGWAPAEAPTGGIYGYTTDDIYYLEAVTGVEFATCKPLSRLYTQ